MIEFRLGRSIAQIIPFQPPIKKQAQKEIITNKLLITMVIVAISKVAINIDDVVGSLFYYSIFNLTIILIIVLLFKVNF